jgi:hypothetical protein
MLFSIFFYIQAFQNITQNINHYLQSTHIPMQFQLFGLVLNIMRKLTLIAKL